MENFDHTEISLESTSKLFEFERISREINTCNDVETLKDMCRCFYKLHLKQQEVTKSLIGRYE
jgi:hypothetical protein